jgi:methionine-rich copper-binding protein CopC
MDVEVRMRGTRWIAGRALAGAVAAVAGVACALLVGGAPALAHNALTNSSPADGARVARPPAVVRLTFLARLDADRTRVTVTGPDGASAAGGAPRFAHNRVTVPFRAGPAGRYTIAYSLPSADGHPIRGDVTFTLTAGAAPATTAPAPTAPATTAPAPTAPATTAPATAGPADVDPELAAGDEAAGGVPWWLWVLGAVAAALLAAGGFAAARNRRR